MSYMKSTERSVARCQELLRQFLALCPEAYVRNEAVTTSSIYVKTPDGLSLRIADHRGREQYKYKWNLNPNLMGSKWKKDGDSWRFYSNSAYDIFIEMKKSQFRKDHNPVFAVI